MCQHFLSHYPLYYILPPGVLSRNRDHSNVVIVVVEPDEYEQRRKKERQFMTLVQVARLYYEEKLGQQEIANQLGVSRSLIAQYLQKAREQDIVGIEINDPLSSSKKLSGSIRNKSKLKQVEVVPQAHLLKRDGRACHVLIEAERAGGGRQSASGTQEPGLNTFPFTAVQPGVLVTVCSGCSIEFTPSHRDRYSFSELFF
jgi:predicted DNA-binding protein (UPF0251 family)